MTDEMTAEEFNAAYEGGDDVELIGHPLVLVGEFDRMPFTGSSVRPDLTFGANVRGVLAHDVTADHGVMPGAILTSA